MISENDYQTLQNARKKVLHSLAGFPSLITHHYCVCVLNNNKRLYMGFKDDRYCKQIKHILDDIEYVYTKNQGGIVWPIIYEVFPFANKDLINLKIKPHDGGVLPLIQREYAVTSAKDKNNKLFTHGLDSCKGILLHNLNTGMAGLAHIDTAYMEGGTFDTILEKVGNNEGNKYILGLTRNVNPLSASHIKKELEGRINREFEIDKQILYNVATGQIEFISQELIAKAGRCKTFDKRLERLHHMMDNNMISCVCGYEPKP
ncbi:MAG: hypothetical protein CVU81_01795 [Euryarchaeota archaeon HGW-Euryarchaeota-1]|nr:MAG: hypothetical protein CVU81_01795 [Euryarchaeota archaeon HGW-Euryarchaeota-1]